MNQSIDSLIREQKISPEIGTSLINDSAYMYEIKQNLVQVAQTVVSIFISEAIEAERELTLDKGELLEAIRPDSVDKNRSL